MKVSQLKKNPGNPRQIKGEKLELLKKSVGSFQKMMELRPMIVDEDFVVLGGNMRLAAIKALGLKEIPDTWVRQVTDLTDDEKKEFIIKDNNSFGEYDWDAIANEWSDLLLADWGLDVPGFEAIDEPEGDADAEPQIDKAAELNKKWKVKSGDLWQIGEHRLLCGDSTNRDDVELLMGGETASLMVTDPPYNVSIDYGDYVDDDKSEVDYASFSTAWFLLWSEYSARQIVTPGGKNMARWCRYFDPYHIAPWTKSNSMTNGKVARWWCWEPVFFFGEQWPRTRSNDIFEYPIGQQKKTGGHPCPKPLTMWSDLISSYSEAGEIVLEPFSGSGTTHVASQNTSRRCFGMEMESKYCAVILERMQTAFPDIEIKRIENAKTKGTT